MEWWWPGTFFDFRFHGLEQAEFTWHETPYATQKNTMWMNFTIILDWFNGESNALRRAFPVVKIDDSHSLNWSSLILFLDIIETIMREVYYVNCVRSWTERGRNGTYTRAYYLLLIPYHPKMPDWWARMKCPKSISGAQVSVAFTAESTRLLFSHIPFPLFLVPEVLPKLRFAF